MNSPDVRLEQAFCLLEKCEQHAGAGVLAVRLQERDLGYVVSWNRRVCLITQADAPDWPAQLPSNKPERAELVRSLYRRAVEGRQRFGDVVVDSGPAVADGVRDTLLDLSAQNLAAMVGSRGVEEAEVCSHPAPLVTDWSAVRPDYADGLTFSLLDTYRATARILDDQPPDRATRVFETFASDCRLALLLKESPPGSSIPVAVQSRPSTVSTLSELRRIGYAAHRMSHPSGLEAAGVRPKLLTFGPSWNHCIMLATQDRTAVLCGADPAARAMIAQATLQDERSGE